MVKSEVVVSILLCLFSVVMASNSFSYDYSLGIHWNDADLPVPYYVNTSGYTGGTETDAVNAIQASLNTWTNAPTSYFEFNYIGTTSQSNAGTNDGVNIMVWGSITEPGYENSIALNTYWYIPSSDELVDSDIIFNSIYSWSHLGEAGKYDIQNIGTHELGHSLSLNDLYGAGDTEKTMYGYGSLGETKKRSLQQDDIDGITYIYTCTDADGDGYSVEGDSCGPIDCNDTDASINPGATEVCDGIDNDCNGQTDEGFPDTDTDGEADCVDNCPNDANADQSDLDTDGVGDVCDYGDTMLTSSGLGVVLDFSDISSMEVSIIFSEVTNSGYTNVNLTGTGPELAVGYEMLGSYYDIKSSAIFSGAVDVCIIYSAPGMSQAQELSLVLLHWETDAWVDVTTSLDTESNQVCGQVTSFSMFVVAKYVGSGGGDGGGGCFIATAAYGTPLAKEVQILSRFRDTYLLPNSLGQKLVSVYYSLSPPIARYIKDNAYLKVAVRGILKPLVWIVESLFVEDNKGEEALLHSNQCS